MCQVYVKKKQKNKQTTATKKKRKKQSETIGCLNTRARPSSIPLAEDWHCSFHLRLLSARGATQALSLPPNPSMPRSAAACDVFVSSNKSSISLHTSNAGMTTNSIKPEETE